MGDLVRFSITMDDELLSRFDELVASRGTEANRSEAVRDLVRDALVENEVENPDAEIAGTITMVFDHHESDLSDKLNAIQHEFVHEIVSTVHIHLDHEYCLEVIILRGASAKVRAIANALLGTKGVKHGKLVTTTTGAVAAGAPGGGTHMHWHAHAHEHPHGHEGTQPAEHPHNHTELEHSHGDAAGGHSHSHEHPTDGPSA